MASSLSRGAFSRAKACGTNSAIEPNTNNRDAFKMFRELITLYSPVVPTDTSKLKKPYLEPQPETARFAIFGNFQRRASTIAGGQDSGLGLLTHSSALYLPFVTDGLRTATFTRGFRSASLT